MSANRTPLLGGVSSGPVLAPVPREVAVLVVAVVCVVTGATGAVTGGVVGASLGGVTGVVGVTGGAGGLYTSFGAGYDLVVVPSVKT